jgi:hypothetical protein
MEIRFSAHNRTHSNTRTHRRTAFIMAPEFTTARLELNLPKERMENPEATTPSEWFALKFPEAANKFGCPFLEIRQSSVDGFVRIVPVSLNIDFFAGTLGGDSGLGHSVVYFEPEMQFYYFEPLQKLYKPTTSEKLQNYHRAIMLRCAQEMNGEIDKLNLFQEFRSDKTSKAVVQRAKSILAASSDFFSAVSPHTRIKGIELHERLARKFVEELLSAESGQVLSLADAYAVFLRLTKAQNLETIRRNDFKAMVVPLIQEQFGMCLRNDLQIDERSGVRGWKNVKLLSQTVPS